MASGPAVILAITRKRYPGAAMPLLENLQLTLAPASVVALVGPSGVGKSTLLRMIAGIDRDFVGAISIDDMPAHAAPTPGFVFQDPRLLPWLSAADNIMAVAPAITPVMAATVLAQVGLEGAGALYPHQLSGGMQRRVALARALSVNAGLLLLDEPFVSLDRTLVADIQQTFIQLVGQAQPTVVLVTHLADDAARLADRAIVLHGLPARIVADIALPVPPARRDATILAAYRGQVEAASRPPYSL